jgi:hypothetical protein
MHKYRIPSRLEIQQQQPETLSWQILDPADSSLPLPTRLVTGLEALSGDIQYWLCMGCDRIHTGRNAAWFCCKIGTKLVRE